MRNLFLIRGLLLLLFAFAPHAAAASQSAKARPLADGEAIQRTRSMVGQVLKDSYPELSSADIQVQSFASKSDYFRTSFDFQRFLFGRKMRYVIKVNPRVFELGAPEEALRAILAHELGHVFDFHRQKRVRLLGLVRLSGKGYTARFERGTDLQAIARGYGDGLKAYRRWLYQNIPATKVEEKRRNYFSPEEIDAIEAKRKQNPVLMQHWFHQVPRNLQEIEASK
jgi:hypothetical protein